MAGASESILVSAVSNAGELEVIGSCFAQASWLECEIKKTKLLPDYRLESKHNARPARKSAARRLPKHRSSRLFKRCADKKVAVDRKR
jgi:NAD(P)H-dependent flavin oxidoreductase YrpB (nitropropane dioxygenase family)